jgi:GTPase SAR1 family protein
MLQIWDTAGQERFHTWNRLYFKDALGALVVVDVSRKETLEQVDHMKQELDRFISTPDLGIYACGFHSLSQHLTLSFACIHIVHVFMYLFVCLCGW